MARSSHRSCMIQQEKSSRVGVERKAQCSGRTMAGSADRGYSRNSSIHFREEHNAFLRGWLVATSHEYGWLISAIHRHVQHVSRDVDEVAGVDCVVPLKLITGPQFTAPTE